MQAADAESRKPRVFVKLTRQTVCIHSDTELELTFVDTDLEVICNNAYLLCGRDEIDTESRYYSSFRHDPVYSKLLTSPD